MEGATTLRPMTEADMPFLAEVYASTRREEVARTGWSIEQVDAFLGAQFEAQHRYYLEAFPDARFDVIEQDGQPAGRLYVQRGRQVIRVVDIALLPRFRNLGIGTALLRSILREGEDRGLPVRMHVERDNPALALYRRLGFGVVRDRGIYLLLEHPPGGATGPSPV
jgi:ribosomal protein S18 acetylase RimI-like enzyme